MEVPSSRTSMSTPGSTATLVSCLTTSAGGGGQAGPRRGGRLRFQIKVTRCSYYSRRERHCRALPLTQQTYHTLSLRLASHRPLAPRNSPVGECRSIRRSAKGWWVGGWVGSWEGRWLGGGGGGAPGGWEGGEAGWEGGWRLAGGQGGMAQRVRRQVA